MQVAPRGWGKKKPAVTALPPPRKLCRRARAARLFSPDKSRDGSGISSRGTSLPSAPSKPYVGQKSGPRQFFAVNRLGKDFPIFKGCNLERIRHSLTITSIT